MSQGQRPCLVLGVGNPDCGDDAAGRAVARRLRERIGTDAEVVEFGGDAAAMMVCLRRGRAAYIIDAAAPSGEPGRVRRFDVGQAPLPAVSARMSTHGMGLCEALELARALGDLPPFCVVFSIEGVSFDPGGSLSPSVARAVEHVSGQICAEIYSGTPWRAREHA